MYDDSSHLMVTVKNLFNEFQRRRTSVFDEPCSDASKIATAEDNMTKIHDLALEDRRLKVHEIAKTVGRPCGLYWALLTHWPER